MAATIAFRTPGEGFHPEKVPGAYFEAQVTITADAAYAAGGYAFGLSQLKTLYTGANELDSVDVVNHWSTAAGLLAAVAVYDNTNAKVQAFVGNVSATYAASAFFSEVPNNSATLSGLICVLRIRFR